LARTILLALTLCFAGGLATLPARAQTSPQQLPEELRGAKVYTLPEETKPGEEVENPVIYRSLSYEDINFDRLLLNIALSVKPVDREATIRKIYFQDFRVNGIPVHIAAFDKEFKLSKKEVVDLPAPLQCSIVFSDLDSVSPLKEIVSQDKIRITGQSFIEVKLNLLAKVALRSKRLVLPVEVNEEVPLQMFSGNPLLQMAASRILDVLSDPATEAAISLGREHLAKLAADRTLSSLGQASLYVLYCEYALRDPKTGVEEKFSQSGTGFILSPKGELLTAKRVVQPWKFDPQIALLMERHHLELDPKSYRLAAWPAGALLVTAQGAPDLEAALRSDRQALRLVKTAPDRMQEQDYEDFESGEKVTLNLHVPGENDVALLQLSREGFRPLEPAEPAAAGGEARTALVGFPYALSQARAEPKLSWVKAARQDSGMRLERSLNPGEAGAPLLTSEGKVLALCGGPDECVPIQTVRRLIQ
jgi:hypothetical protein